MPVEDTKEENESGTESDGDDDSIPELEETAGEGEASGEGGVKAGEGKTATPLAWRTLINSKTAKPPYAPAG